MRVVDTKDSSVARVAAIVKNVITAAAAVNFGPP
jgi:hypothetical protein